MHEALLQYLDQNPRAETVPLERKAAYELADFLVKMRTSHQQLTQQVQGLTAVLVKLGLDPATELSMTVEATTESEEHDGEPESGPT